MKVFISADIEGVSGLVAWSQCGRPNGQHYDYAWARQRMTADVNAAIRGAKAAGATEVVVRDAHGNSKNLLADQLEPGTRLSSGEGSTTMGMMAGLETDFTCAFLVGYHAMAGTLNGVMEHTISGRIHRLWVNEQEIGEIGISAAVAGCFDIPIVLVTSDLAGCHEAMGLLPGVVTACVKKGTGRYMAECLHPDDAAVLIEMKAREAVEKASSLDAWLPSSPAEVRIEFNRSEEADMAGRLPGVRRVNGYTIEFSGDTWSGAHQSIWAALLMAELGHKSTE